MIVAAERLDPRNIDTQWGDLRQLTASFLLRHPNLKHPDRFVFCQCKCGAIIRIRERNLHVKRRGCSKCKPSNYSTHRLSHLPEYGVWCQMIRRCHDITHDKWDYYGKRGIVVCDRWRNSFKAFLEDVGRRPSDGHQLDRYPNNAGNYEPGNVRWATIEENLANRRM